MDCSTQVLFAIQNEEPDVWLNHFWLQFISEKVEEGIYGGFAFRKE